MPGITGLLCQAGADRGVEHLVAACQEEIADDEHRDGEREDDLPAP